MRSPELPDDIRSQPALGRDKFQDFGVTADGAKRAFVALSQLNTVWFNTGTLCNLTCVSCYIESSPVNDRLAYLTEAEVGSYLDELDAQNLGVREIGFTGGEPFMNPEIMAMLALCLARGFDVLVLTNAMKPMHHKMDALLHLKALHGARLKLRVSVDHHTSQRHEELRGPGSWAPMIEGLTWLAANGFDIAAAGRSRWDEDASHTRAAYAELFRAHAVPIDTDDGSRLVLFPEMDAALDVPEIATACWDILGLSPDAMMCATSRMVVKEKGGAPKVMPCTLLPYDSAFDMGPDLASSRKAVSLNHPHCARFCVLGGGSCSAS
ncbi:MAG: radical SAM protein [Rhodospirillaceae bacterium]|nr:radical SAM protein [Rhodospirillaceae bacterium]